MTKIHEDIFTLLNDGKIEDAQLLYTEYVMKNKNNKNILCELYNRFRGLPLAYGNITRDVDFAFIKYMNDILYMIDFPAAFNDLAYAYTGIDGDEMDMYGVTERHPKLTIQLSKRATELGSYKACTHMVLIFVGLYRCNDPMFYLVNDYAFRPGHEYNGPMKTFYKEQIKKYLVDGMKIYNEIGPDPTIMYPCNDTTGLFVAIPNEILCEMIEKDPTFVFSIPTRSQSLAPNLYLPIIKRMLNIPDE